MNVRQIIVDDILFKGIKVGCPLKLSEALNLLNKGIDEETLKQELKLLCEEGYLVFTKRTYTGGEYRPTEKFYEDFSKS